jgi:hypothetical protein
VRSRVTSVFHVNSRTKVRFKGKGRTGVYDDGYI